MRKLICTAVVLMGAHLGLTACGPVPYETSPHPVEVATTAESAGQHLDAARIWAVENDPFLQGVLAEIREIKKNATVVSAKEFMDTVFPGQHSVAIEELAAEQAVDRIQDLSVTHIILIEHRATGNNIHGKVTAVASLITADQLNKVETLSFDAEGHRAGLSLPLPYIFLIFPYSDPDVLGSATAKIASALSDKITEAPDRPLGLTILASDNLAGLVASTRAQPPADEDSSHSANPVKRWRNPVGFYSDIMSDWREEGEWPYYNPLAHIQMLFTSIIMAPTMIVVDVFVDTEPKFSEPQEPTSRNADSQQYAVDEINRNADWQQFGYANDAINREDWDAGYRLLEDFVASEDEMLKLRTLQLLEDHPELLDAALGTFSKEALEESRKTYGADAIAIEKERLEEYRKVARPEAYSRARDNFFNVYLYPEARGSIQEGQE